MYATQNGFTSGKPYGKARLKNTSLRHLAVTPSTLSREIKRNKYTQCHIYTYHWAMQIVKHRQHCFPPGLRGASLAVTYFIPVT